jgi:hypothetical protein
MSLVSLRLSKSIKILSGFSQIEACPESANILHSQPYSLEIIESRKVFQLATETLRRKTGVALHFLAA